MEESVMQLIGVIVSVLAAALSYVAVTWLSAGTYMNMKNSGGYDEEETFYALVVVLGILGLGLFILIGVLTNKLFPIVANG